LERGIPVAAYPDPDEEAYQALNREMRFLTGKKVIYVANVDEGSLGNLDGNPHLAALRKLAVEEGAPLVTICAKLEAQISELDAADRPEFLSAAGLSEPGLNEVIRMGYRLLGLGSYLTAGVKEVRAWTITKGMKAPQAAGVIHSDFERGFIKAETVAYKDLVSCGSVAAARDKGLYRMEGKEYVVADGDVLVFKFNV
jgi:ribosome-binding ATPase YchF (GTP1/OBG family)